MSRRIFPFRHHVQAKAPNFTGSRMAEHREYICSALLPPISSSSERQTTTMLLFRHRTYTGPRLRLPPGAWSLKA
jgi:hypothetical protein